MKPCQIKEINREWQKIQIWAEVPGSSSKSDILQNNWLRQRAFDEREFEIRRIQRFLDFEACDTANKQDSLHLWGKTRGEMSFCL